MRTVTINEAAEIKGISPQAVRAAIKAGKLEVVQVDMPQERITRTSLNAFQPNPNMKRAGRKPANGKNGHKRSK
jgi:predicted site-specific integrase-resolvase